MEQHVIHPVVMGLEHHVHVHIHVPLEVLYQEQHVIRKVVMGLELRAPIHVIQEVPYLALHVIFHNLLPIHIHVHMEVPYLAPHAHFLRQELHNMDAPMVEHKRMVYVYYQQGNVYLPDV